MSKDEIVKALVEQAMGFKIRLITLDAGFYTVDLNFISFKYVIAVPVGDKARSLTGIKGGEFGSTVKDGVAHSSSSGRMTITITSFSNKPLIFS